MSIEQDSAGEVIATTAAAHLESEWSAAILVAGPPALCLTPEESTVPWRRNKA
jgi:hypothetical protein